MNLLNELNRLYKIFNSKENDLGISPFIKRSIQSNKIISNDENNFVNIGDTIYFTGSNNTYCLYTSTDHKRGENKVEVMCFDYTNSYYNNWIEECYFIEISELEKFIIVKLNLD